MLSYTEKQEIYGKSNFEIIGELGGRFRDFRIALGMTQKEAADRCGTNVMTISRFENGGGGSVRLSTFVAMLRALSLLENIYSTIPKLPSMSQPSEPQRVRCSRKKLNNILNYEK